MSKVHSQQWARCREQAIGSSSSGCSPIGFPYRGSESSHPHWQGLGGYWHCQHKPFRSGWLQLFWNLELQSWGPHSLNQQGRLQAQPLGRKGLSLSQSANIHMQSASTLPVSSGPRARYLELRSLWATCLFAFHTVNIRRPPLGFVCSLHHPVCFWFYLCVWGWMLRPAAFDTSNHCSAPQMLTKCLLCAGGPILDPEGSVEGGGAHSEQENQAPRREIPATPVTWQYPEGQNSHFLFSFKGSGRGSLGRSKSPSKRPGTCSFIPLRRREPEEVRTEKSLGLILGTWWNPRLSQCSPGSFRGLRTEHRSAPSSLFLPNPQLQVPLFNIALHVICPLVPLRLKITPQTASTYRPLLSCNQFIPSPSFKCDTNSFFSRSYRPKKKKKKLSSSLPAHCPHIFPKALLCDRDHARHFGQEENKAGLPGQSGG